MQYDDQTIKLFAQIFASNTDFKCVYTPSGSPVEGTKLDGTYRRLKETITFQDYKDHLTGNRSLGVVPITSEQKVKFACIDIDKYPANFTYYENIIENLNLPFVMFKSKSGGLHLFIFFQNEILAKNARKVLEQFQIVFGLTKKTSEIFPKQDTLKKDGQGNVINLPYFGSARPALGDNLEELPLSDALAKIINKMCNLDTIKDLLDMLPLKDAPPCLQSLFIGGCWATREIYLFNLAIYLKVRSPDDWQELVRRANDLLEEPLTEKEITGQVIAANEKGEYSYKCKEAPLCDLCNKEVCYTRKYGKNGDEVSNFSFENLKQFLTDPPKYEFTVNGVKMTFYSEKDLLNQNIFSELCVRYLYIAPNKIKKQNWLMIINKALSDMEVIKVDIADRLDPTSILANYFYKYLTTSAQAKNKRQLAEMGRVYYDPEHSLYYFKRDAIIKHIIEHKNFKFFGIVQLDDKLQSFGVNHVRLYITELKKAVRVWCITEKDLHQLGEKEFDSKELVDLSEFTKEEF